MANYNTSLKRNAGFVAFLKNLRPGWQEIGGRLLRDDQGNAVARTKWLPHEEWWQAYVKTEKSHLKEREISEVAAIIAVGEDCELTETALRFLEFIAGYYSEMNGLKPLRIAPSKARASKPVHPGLEAVAEFAVASQFDTRKIKIVELLADSAIVSVSGQQWHVSPGGKARKVDGAMTSEFDAWARVWCAPRVAGLSESGRWAVKRGFDTTVVEAKTAKEAVSSLGSDWHACSVQAYERSPLYCPF